MKQAAHRMKKLLDSSRKRRAAQKKLRTSERELRRQNEFLNITDRKQVEKALQASETHFRKLMESAPDAILLIQKDGTIVLANKRAEEMFGFAHGELIGQPIHLLIPPGLRERHARLCQEYFSAPRTRPMGAGLELLAQRKDLSTFPVEISLSPMEAGHEMKVIAIVRDVSERKHTEEQLRLQSTALQAAANAIVITDSRGNITWVNPAFTRLTGYSAAEALGQNPRVLKSGQHEPAFYKDLWRTILAGKVWRGQIVNRRKDGSLYTEEMTITPVRDDRQEITHFIAIKEDKQAEESLAWEAAVNAAVAELARALIAQESVEDISYLVLEQAKRLTHSAFGFVGHIDPHNGNLISSTLTRDIWDLCQVKDKNVVFEKFSGLWGWVLQNRQPLLTNDPTSDPRSSGVPEGHIPIRRFLSAPAVLGDKVVGQIALANADRDYTERDQILIERLASLYALAIQRQRADEELRRYASEQAALYAITSAAAVHLDPADMLSNILDIVLPLLGADAGWILQSGPSPDDLLHLVSWRGVPAELLAAEELVPLRDCLVCQPLLASTSASVEPTLCASCPYLSAELVATAGLNSRVGIPLSAGNQVLGMLVVAWRDPRPRETEQTFLATIGRQLGVILHNAQLYQTARQVDQLATLNAISAAAASSLEPLTALHRVLEMTCQALNTAEGSILLRDLETDELYFAVTMEENLASRGLRLARGQGIAGWSVQSGESALVNDVRQDPRFYSGIDEISGFETRSLMCAPLRHHSRITGVVEVVNKRQGQFDDQDLRFLEAVSSIAAAALENARLFSTVRARAEELDLLNKIGTALTATLDHREVVKTALSYIQQLFAGEVVSLLQPVPETGELCFVQALTRKGAIDVPLRFMPGEGLWGWVMEHGLPVRVADMPADPRYSTRLHEYLASRGYEQSLQRSLIAAPLLAAEQPIGVISVSRSEANAYTQEELNTLQAIASTLAVALENARLYEELKTLLREREEAQAKLIHSEKMSALGRLVASIAHEINNPLQSVQGCLTLVEEELQDQKRQDKIEQYLNIAGHEIARISEIVRRMRDFYRPARLQREPTDLHAILDSVLALTNKQLQHSHITVEREWTNEPLVVDANADHLKQVFLNLVINAIDAMPSGGILRIRTTIDRPLPDSSSHPPAVARIEFSDSGIGMPPEVLSRLFEPFFTTKEQGSGLGLSISHGIIESHGGEITVTSQVGVGSTFTILLPLIKQPLHGTD